MTDSLTGGLRALVADAVRDIVSEMVRDSLVADRPGPLSITTHRGEQASAGSMNTSATPGTGRARTEVIRIASDEDLNAFVRLVLGLFENPKNRQDLRAGRLRFTLAPTPGAGLGRSGRTRRIDRGAVTERVVESAHTAGECLVLARGAVLTPLGRERARTLGVVVEKEQ